jgi:hypothetical protein
MSPLFVRVTRRSSTLERTLTPTEGIMTTLERIHKDKVDVMNGTQWDHCPQLRNPDRASFCFHGRPGSPSHRDKDITKEQQQ